MHEYYYKKDIQIKCAIMFLNCFNNKDIRNKKSYLKKYFIIICFYYNDGILNIKIIENTKKF